MVKAEKQAWGMHLKRMTRFVVIPTFDFRLFIQLLDGILFNVVNYLRAVYVSYACLKIVSHMHTPRGSNGLTHVYTTDIMLTMF